MRLARTRSVGILESIFELTDTIGQDVDFLVKGLGVRQNESTFQHIRAHTHTRGGFRLGFVQAGRLSASRGTHRLPFPVVKAPAQHHPKKGKASSVGGNVRKHKRETSKREREIQNRHDAVSEEIRRRGGRGEENDQAVHEILTIGTDCSTAFLYTAGTREYAGAPEDQKKKRSKKR